MDNLKITGIILGGGKSSRMGTDKTFLKIGPETMMERTVREMLLVSDDIIIAGNSLDKYSIPNTREVLDTFPGNGPLGGIHSALQAAKYDVAFVSAGDMPYFSHKIVEYFISRWEDGLDLLTVSIKGRGEPLCAMYHRRCCDYIAKMRADQELHVGKLFDYVPNGRIIDDKEFFADGKTTDCFFNMNTPADYQKVINTK